MGWEIKESGRKVFSEVQEAAPAGSQGTLADQRRKAGERPGRAAPGTGMEAEEHLSALFPACSWPLSTLESRMVSLSFRPQPGHLPTAQDMVGRFFKSLMHKTETIIPFLQDVRTSGL